MQLNSKQFLICRPEGGLNDMLCQIEAAYSYAEATDRCLVVDTNYKNARAFKDKFSTYFSSLNSEMVLNLDEIEVSIDSMSVAPDYLNGKINSYKIEWSSDISNWADSETRRRLSFDFKKSYDEQVLLHHACGGGTASLSALAKLQLKENMINLLSDRIDQIGQPYSAIHVRNTDYKTDYKSSLIELKKYISLPVFIATDDNECRDFCIELFGKNSVKYFTSLPEGANVPLHAEHIYTSAFQRNSEAILDLLVLALSKQFFKVSLAANLHHVNYSGFSILAENLKNSPNILASLLGQSDLAKSILHKTNSWKKQ